MKIDSDRMDEIKDVEAAASAAAGSVGPAGVSRNNLHSSNGPQYSIPGILHFLQLTFFMSFGCTVVRPVGVSKLGCLGVVVHPRSSVSTL